MNEKLKTPTVPSISAEETHVRNFARVMMRGYAKNFRLCLVWARKETFTNPARHERWMLAAGEDVHLAKLWRDRSTGRIPFTATMITQKA